MSETPSPDGLSAQSTNPVDGYEIVLSSGALFAENAFDAVIHFAVVAYVGESTLDPLNYRPSPFFILDEVDAAFDNLNAAKVTGFILSKSCEGSWGQDIEGGSGFQSIVISLKDIFYDKVKL